MAYSKTRYCLRCQDTAMNERNLPPLKSVCVCVSPQAADNKQAKYIAYEIVLPTSRSTQKVNRDTEHGACLSFIL